MLEHDLKMATTTFRGNRFRIDGEIAEKHALQIYKIVVCYIDLNNLLETYLPDCEWIQHVISFVDFGVVQRGIQEIQLWEISSSREKFFEKLFMENHNHSGKMSISSCIKQERKIYYDIIPAISRKKWLLPSFAHRYYIFHNYDNMIKTFF